MTQILGICGSLQAKSSNLELLRTAATITSPGVRFTLYDGIRALPLFDPDLLTGALPDEVQDWCDVLVSHDGLLIASPEYGHSLPGALKNAIDWVIGSGELYRKVVALTASVPGPQRGLLGLAALRQTLEAVEVQIVGGEPIVRGASFDTEVAELMASLLRAIASSP